jgi:hypothetical protein
LFHLNFDNEKGLWLAQELSANNEIVKLYSQKADEKWNAMGLTKDGCQLVQ